MKNIARIVALLLLLGCLSACMPNKDTPDATTPGLTTAPQLTTGPDATPGLSTTPADTPQVILSKIPLSSIATPIVTERLLAEDGAVLVDYTYQNVFLIYPDAAVANALYLSLVNAMDYSTGLQDTLTMAREAYTEDPDSWKPYEYRVLYSPMRIDQSVISVYGQTTVAAQETSSMPISSSYSLIDGKHLTFVDIQAGAYHYYTLLTKIDTQLRSLVPADQLFEDYQETIAKQLRSTDATNWYFTESGLCFYYLPMEIASNSLGVITVEVPYSELQGLLKDDYFPAEDYVTGGNLYAQLFSEAQLFNYQQFCEVIQDSDGEEILLSTDGAVTDIRLEYGSWNAGGTEFIPTAVIFACDGISEESAIVVQCQLPDVMPALRLSYVSQGVTYTRYIAQSGKDGSILLLENP